MFLLLIVKIQNMSVFIQFKGSILHNSYKLLHDDILLLILRLIQKHPIFNYG